jgi:hypothetical protein
MLPINLRSHCQLSAQHFSGFCSNRGFRQKNKPLALPILGLVFIFFGQTCRALETASLPKRVIIPVSSKVSNHLPAKLQNTLWWKIAKLHQLDPYILYAVALVESARGIPSNHVTPWPWAINKSGKSIIPGSQQEARIILNRVCSVNQP